MQALITILVGAAIYFGCMALIALPLLAMPLSPQSWRYTAEDIEVIAQRLEMMEVFVEQWKLDVRRDVDSFVLIHIDGMQRRADAKGGV